MRTIMCNAPRELQLIDTPFPRDKDGHIRVRIGHIGICGTDYHIYVGQQPFLNYPRVMGHELSGRAVQAASDGRFGAVDQVVVNPYLTCGSSRACSLGKPNCCENIAVLGVHTDGGMCREIVVPESNLIAANGLSGKAAAMVEFLAIGAHGVRRARIAKGSSILIVGAGPIGIAAALFASIDGSAVTLRDTSKTRLELAKSVLPDAVFEISGAEADRVYDTVFDATGNINAINAGLSWLTHGGSYVLLSVVKDDLRFADPEFHKREATLIGSRNALAVDFDHVISSIQNGTVLIEKLATHETSFADAVTNLPLWAEDRETLIKALIVV